MRQENPIVFVMVGIPGSGKSTARDMLNAAYFVSSDWHVERLAKQQGKTYNAAFRDVIKEATSELNKDVDFMINLNQSFVWDQTNLNVSKRSSILGRIPNHYNKVAVFLDVPIETALDRNRKRDRTIDDSIILSMANSLVKPTLDEGFDAIITIDHNGNISEYREMTDAGIASCAKEDKNGYR